MRRPTLSGFIRKIIAAFLLQAAAATFAFAVPPAGNAGGLRRSDLDQNRWHRPDRNRGRPNSGRRNRDRAGRKSHLSQRFRLPRISTAAHRDDGRHDLRPRLSDQARRDHGCDHATSRERQTRSRRARRTLLAALRLHGKERITVRELLTHYSGLKADVDLGRKWNGNGAALKMIEAEMPLYPPGTHYRYSDVNFEALGEIVRRVSGLALDVYCQERIFGPLGMTGTSFRPPAAERDRIAPPFTSTAGCAWDWSTTRLRRGWRVWPDTRVCSPPPMISQSLCACCWMADAREMFGYSLRAR